MNLTETYMLLAVMLAVVAVVSVLFRGKIGLITPVIFLAGLITALVAGMGFRLREVTEGAFAYVDHTMWVLCAAIFVFILKENGTFDYIFEKIVAKKRNSSVQLLLLVLFIAIPGMLTGTIMASVATTGWIAGKYLLDKGANKTKIVEIVAVSSFMGMLFPPISLPVIAVTVVNNRFSSEGFFLYLLVLALPAMVIYSVVSGNRILGELNYEDSTPDGKSVVCVIPLVVVFVLVLVYNLLYSVVPYFGGYPVIFLIGIVLALVLKRKSGNLVMAVADSARSVCIELAMVMAFASVVETFQLVGVNGTIAAQLAIAQADGTLVAIVLLVLLLVTGFVLGAPFAYTLGALATYLCGGAEMLIAVVLSVAILASMRGGVSMWVSTQLEIEAVSSKQILKQCWVPILILIVIAAIYFVAPDQVAFLQI